MPAIADRDALFDRDDLEGFDLLAPGIKRGRFWG